MKFSTLHLRSNTLQQIDGFMGLNDEPVLEKPQDFIDELSKVNAREKDLIPTLQSLQVSLTEYTTGWAQEFGSDGLNCVLRLLRRCTGTPPPVENCIQLRDIAQLQYQCVSCVLAYLRRMGLNPILQADDGIDLLARCLCLHYPEVMVDAVKLMSCICLDNQHKVLKVIQKKSIFDDSTPLKALIGALKGKHYPISLKIACLQMINALMQGKEGALNVSIRQELINEGFVDALPTLRTFRNEKLEKQLKIFDDAKYCSVIDMGFCKLQFDE